MGKKTKAHRAKVEKRNRKIAQEKHATQSAFNKFLEQLAQEKSNEKLENELNVTIGGQETPFSVVDESELVTSDKPAEDQTSDLEK